MATTVLQLSDIHFAGSPDRLVEGHDPAARLEAVLDTWAARHGTADLVLLTGDNADDGSPEAYARLAPAVQRLAIPVLAVPGNHDVAHRVAVVFGTRRTAEVGTWRVVGLDSSRPDQIHGTIDVPAALRLLDDLDARPTVVAIHHPPVSPSTHEWFQLDGADALLDGLAARPHVRMVVSGHLHEAFEYEGPGQLSLLGCPSTLVGIRHRGESYEIGADIPTGARVLHLGDDGRFTSSLVAA